ncbi:uncharacterized protein TRIADDRAFT_55259 [Trichoplax adhaerens]|uniref:Fibronectin type-III domain-containing protein n=1 Tax=Trichoplax adhaerens TaxID=10228 RepID=B3RUE5_TRIAD|nr:predicted protein [Trichoplax adhaerens]EDV25798.1 predicted protein [Trichoplax adhaerens]|eukprot:XP_002111831.1 predicted protein [Trichoplax adhaerens]
MSDVIITPNSPISPVIHQTISLQCTARLIDNQGRPLDLLSFGKVEKTWPPYLLVMNSNKDYLIDEGDQSTVKSFYNKSMTNVTIGITILNITTSHDGIYKCAASYFSAMQDDKKTIKLNVLVPPKEPKHFELVNRSNSSALFTWSHADDNHHKHHYVVECASTNHFCHSIQTDTNQTSLILKGLKPQNCYTCTLLSRDYIGDSLKLMLLVGAASPFKCCRSSSTSSSLDILSATITDETGTLQTTTNPTTTTEIEISTTIKKESMITDKLIPSASTVCSPDLMITATQTSKPDVETSTILNSISPTHTNSLSDSHGINDTRVNTTAVDANETRQSVTQMLSIGISVGFCLLVIIGGILYRIWTKRLEMNP